MCVCVCVRVCVFVSVCVCVCVKDQKSAKFLDLLHLAPHNNPKWSLPRVFMPLQFCSYKPAVRIPF